MKHNVLQNRERWPRSESLVFKMGTYTGDKRKEAVKKHSFLLKPGWAPPKCFHIVIRWRGIWLLELHITGFWEMYFLYSCNCCAHNFFHLQVSAGLCCRVCLIAYLVIPLVFAFSFLLARVDFPLVLKFLRDRGHNCIALCFSPALLVCGVRRMNIYYHFVDIIKW